MPYKRDGSDAPDYVPADKKKQWAAVWNDVYEREIAKGASKDDAEKAAFAEASAAIKKENNAMKTFTLRTKLTAPAFSASAADGVVTIDIMDMIGADFFGEGITASAVTEAIKQAGEYGSISLNINSPGGDLFQGVAIYNTLKATGKPVNVNVIGLAASAASLIACAGDTITMGLGTQYMLHEAMAMEAGYADDMRKMADTLDSVTNSAADIYATKTGLSKNKILAMMKAETWMSPEEAVKNGFADSVSKTQAKVTNSFDLSVFKHAPKMAAKTVTVDGEQLTAADHIYAGDPEKTDTWALPWHFSTEAKTVSHLRNALARFDQDTVIPVADRPAAKAKLNRLAKEHGIDVESAKEDKGEGGETATNKVEFDALPILRKQIEISKRK